MKNTIRFAVRFLVVIMVTALTGGISYGADDEPIKPNNSCLVYKDKIIIEGVGTFIPRAPIVSTKDKANEAFMASMASALRDFGECLSKMKKAVNDHESGSIQKELDESYRNGKIKKDDYQERKEENRREYEILKVYRDIFSIFRVISDSTSDIKFDKDNKYLNKEELLVTETRYDFNQLSLSSKTIVKNYVTESDEIIIDFRDGKKIKYIDFVLSSKDDLKHYDTLRAFYKKNGLGVKVNRLKDGITAFTLTFNVQKQNYSSAISEVQQVLRIDTGNHVGLIKNIAITKDGRQLVSASIDKTIRVWDVQKQNEVRKILGQIGEGLKGSMSTLALSPDDRYLAVAGDWPSEDYSDTIAIRIYDFRTGRLASTIKSHEDIVSDLSFSPDGRYLASASDDKTVRVWETNKIIKGDQQPLQILNEHSGAVSSVRIFKYKGEYRVVSGGNKEVVLYSLDEKRVLKTFPFHDVAHYLEVTSIGEKGYIVVAGRDNKIEILDTDLDHIKTISSDAKPTGLAFSPDGKLLLVAEGASSIHCDIYDTFNNFQKRTSFKGHDNTISAVAFLDNQTAVSAGGNNYDIYIWDVTTGKEKKHIAGKGQTIWSVGIRGQEIAFGNTDRYKNPQDRGPLEKSFRLNDLVITQPTGTYKRIPTTWGSYTLTLKPGDDKTLIIKKGGGITAEIKSDNLHITYGFTEGGFIITGGNKGTLNIYNIKGWHIANLIGHIEPISGIAVENDILVSGSFDQTIRTWNLKRIKKLSEISMQVEKEIYPEVSIFISKDNEWVVWTEEGFFNASKNGARFIGYHINRGIEKAAEFVSVDKLYNIFYRPDLVEAKLAGKNISQYAKNINIEEILAKGGLPPKVNILTASGKSEERDIKIMAELCDNGGGIGDITLFLNDMPISITTGERGLQIVRKASSSDKCFSLNHLITLQSGENNIAIMAHNKTNTIESERNTIRIVHQTALASKPNLHILVMAVDKYRDGDLRLKYSLNDAKAIIESMKKKSATLFDGFYVYELYDEQVTKDSLDKKFTEIGKKTGREDVFLLFVAGHGITNDKDGGYYFLPVDFRYTGEEAIAAQGISMNDFKRYLTHIQAMKSLLLLDTCNSGSFVEAIASRGVLEKTAISKLTRAVGRATLAASSKNQVALEGYEGHGVFTYTVLEALQGKAADNQGKITINGLATYVEELLPQITYKKWGYEQIPQKSLQGMDFPIGMK